MIYAHSAVVDPKLVKPNEGVVLICFGVHGINVNPFDFFKRGEAYGFESIKLLEEDVANPNGDEGNSPQMLYYYLMRLST